MSGFPSAERPTDVAPSDHSTDYGPEPILGPRPMDALCVWDAWSRVSRGELAPDTWRSYASAGLRFLAVGGLARRQIGEITRSDILSFYGDHVPRGHARCLMHAALSSLFRYADLEGLVTSNPMAGIRPRRPRESEPLALSEDELSALVVEIARLRGQRAAYGILLGYLLGLRRKELAGLRWENIIDGPQPVARLIETKGSHPRNVPISDDARLVLAELRRLPSRYQRRTRAGFVLGVNRATISEWVHKAAISAGIDPAKAHSHILRASFATHALAAGADVRTVGKLLGHATLGPILRYLAVLDSRMREAVNLIHAPRLDEAPLPAAESA